MSSKLCCLSVFRRFSKLSKCWGISLVGKDLQLFRHCLLLLSDHSQSCQAAIATTARRSSRSMSRMRSEVYYVVLVLERMCKWVDISNVGFHECWHVHSFGSWHLVSCEVLWKPGISAHCQASQSSGPRQVRATLERFEVWA